jgi:tRNA(Arg) A34 adenosine deaminase TadA
MYSTTEPCPMCFSAIHWARISKVWWGTGIEDVMRLGFNELPLNNADIINITASEVLIEGGVCIDECRKLLEYWDSLPDKKVY